uniref:Helicase C-terminal domain-containing protein n=1 Tax=Pavo cristatus TaxID=9049 RepID=A0A8C9FC37_PAVCR
WFVFLDIKALNMTMLENVVDKLNCSYIVYSTTVVPWQNTIQNTRSTKSKGDLNEKRNPTISKEIYEVAVSLIQSFDELEMQLMTEKKTLITLFLGFAEISYMHSRLTRMFNKKWQVYPLHSRVSLEEQNNVFLNPVPGYRKVILFLFAVIDFCLTRTVFCDEETNYQSLRLCWASKTNCYQRRGRAGRVSNGYCYRLVHKDFWADCIPEKSLPEMLTCPLGATVLKIKKLDMGEPKALLATALSPPNLSDIERTILHLKEVGALTACVQAEENPSDGELTFLGNVLVHLPVDLHLGKLIVLGHVFGCLEECLIIGKRTTYENFCISIITSNLQVFILISFYCIVRNLFAKLLFICTSHFLFQDELEWGQLNYVHIKKVREVMNVDYQKQTVEPVEVSFGTSQLLKMIPNRLLSISVTEIVEVGHFWGYRIDEKNRSVLQTLTAELNYQNFTDLSVSPHPELVCLAPFTRLENTGYYRARILYVCGDFAEALEFKICKMRPSAKSLICGGRWSYSASRRFASLVNGYSLLVDVYSLVHSVLHVDAFHYTRHRNLVNIRDALIEEHYAELAEESYESQVRGTSSHYKMKVTAEHCFSTQSSS